MKRLMLLAVLMVPAPAAREMVGEGWTIQEPTPDQFILYYMDSKGREDGWKQICGKGYQCVLTPGVVHVEEIRRLKK